VTTDPEEWLQGATKLSGSWWGDWLAWLDPRSGECGTLPSMGNDHYKPIEPAPGAYVREMGGEAKYPTIDVVVESESSAGAGV
jgi:poly(3-hydroxyalkanoate) synthetase